jgi:uncharacterized protein YcbK (DUF882 family)
MGRFRKPRLVQTEQHMSRRRFLSLGAFATTLSLCPRLSVAHSRRPAFPEKSLAIVNTNTGEKLKRVYWFRGAYLSDALRDINRIFRDHHAGEIRSIDPQLLDLLYAISKQVGATEPLHIVSGYRSAITNATLRLQNAGVAEHSLHIQGKAADIYIPGRSNAIVRQAAMSLRKGGVGYYPDARFIHVDTGPVRFW